MLGRLVSPPYYLALFGTFQLVSLWALQWRIGLVPLAVAVAGFLVVLGLLLTPAVGDRGKQAGVLALIGLVTVLPTLVLIATRPHLGYTIEHDGLMQTESAIDRVLHGQAIYGVDWSHTPIGRFPWNLTPQGNPAVHHYAYFPLTVLSGIPFALAASLLHVPFDYRMVLLAFLLIGLVAVVSLPVPTPARLSVAIALFVDPQITSFFFMGRNDIAFLAMVLLSFALLARGRPGLSCLALGFGIALKPFAVLAVPFLALAIWLGWRRTGATNRWRQAVVFGLALAAPAVLTITPFALANPGAIWRDTVLFTNGGIPDAYPINGQGFSAILYAAGVIAHRTDPFPFGLFQLVATVPAVLLGAYLFLRRPTFGRWLAAYTLALFAFAFFSRFFNDNYVGDVIALACCVPALAGIPLLEPRRETVPLATAA